jgi:3-keto-5-aminohexanoate cleavage enzyme
MQNKFLINVCLNGMMATKKDNPHLPISEKEIARDVEECVALGASIVHVHARNESGAPAFEKDYYESIIRCIRSVSRDVVICVSTSGRLFSDIEKRIACLDTNPRPDMASLTMGSIDFPQQSSMNSLKTVTTIAQAIYDRGLKPEIEIFDVGMARTTSRLIHENIFKGPCYANILLGNTASADAALLDLSAVLNHLPKEVLWCAAGIGKMQLKANMLGILYGQGVRVGLEDSLYMDGNKTIASNVSLVERIAKMGELLGRSPYTISETRQCLGL